MIRYIMSRVQQCNTLEAKDFLSEAAIIETDGP